MIEFPTGLNSQTPADNSQILCADNSNVAGKFTLSALWTWISNKISAIFASDVTFGDNITVGNSVYVNANVECNILEATQIISTGDVSADSVTADTSIQVGTSAGGAGTKVEILPYFDGYAGQDNEQTGISVIITNYASGNNYQFDITAKKLTDLLALV